MGRGRRRNICRVSWGNLIGRVHLEDPQAVDSGIILHWLLKK
jgi:hypothetical protein